VGISPHCVQAVSAAELTMEDDAAKQRPLFPAESLPSLICEFFGTFIFQFMAGCVVLGASSLTTAALGIGFTLMVPPAPHYPISR